MALTPKQRRFVDEYLVDLNGKQAAIRAGCSPRSAEVTASKWLRIPKVRDAVAVGQKKIAEKLEIDATLVLRELLTFARTDIRKAFDSDGRLLPIHKMPEEVARAISGFETEELWEGAPGEKVNVGQVRKVKFWDKVKGLELLGKHLKLFTDKVEHDVSESLEKLLVESMGDEP